MGKILVLIGLWLPLTLSGWLPGTATAQTWRTMTSERQVWDREPLAVKIQYGAGTLRIAPADSPTLYRMELRYNEEGFEPLIAYDQDRRVLQLGVRSRENSRRDLRIREGSTATLGLTREVPLDLDLDFGAGNAEIR